MPRSIVGSEQTAPLAFHAVRVGGKAIMVGLFGGHAEDSLRAGRDAPQDHRGLQCRYDGR